MTWCQERLDNEINNADAIVLILYWPVFVVGTNNIEKVKKGPSKWSFRLVARTDRKKGIQSTHKPDQPVFTPAVLF